MSGWQKKRQIRCYTYLFTGQILPAAREGVEVHAHVAAEGTGDSNAEQRHVSEWQQQ